MTTKTGIIYLQRDKFQIYSPYLPAILEFRFVPELIQDFDLVNRELFENLLKVFLGNNKIPPSSMVIIIADGASFIKDFVSPPPPVAVAPGQSSTPTPPPTLEDLQNQANEYLEHVPFESIASKVFPLATGVRAFATNQEIYDVLKTILEKQGFIISSVLPGFVFGPNLSNRPALDAAILGELLQRLSTVQGYNLLKESLVSTVPAESSLKEEPEERESTVIEEESPLGKQANKKIFIAVAASAIIIIALITGIVVYSQFQERPYKPSVNPPTPTAAPTTAPQPSPVLQSQDVKDLTVQITAPASQSSASAALRAALTPVGFKSIVPQVQTGLGAAQDLLIFSSTVSTEVRNAVTEIVQGTIPDILVQERNDAAADVVIILGE